MNHHQQWKLAYAEFDSVLHVMLYFLLYVGCEKPTLVPLIPGKGAYSNIIPIGFDLYILFRCAF